MAHATLSTTWLDVTDALSLGDGATYVVELHGTPDARILAVDVEGASAPADDDDALVHYCRDVYPAQEALEFTQRAGWTWWLRLKAPYDGVRIVAAQV